MTAVIARIALRHIACALIVKGFLDAGTGNTLATDPDVLYARWPRHWSSNRTGLCRYPSHGLVKMIWSLILGFLKGPLGRILDTINKNTDATIERERIKTEAVQTYVNAQAQVLTRPGWLLVRRCVRLQRALVSWLRVPAGMDRRRAAASSERLDGGNCQFSLHRQGR